MRQTGGTSPANGMRQTNDVKACIPFAASGATIYACIPALMRAMKSGALRAAPPIRPPSISF